MRTSVKSRIVISVLACFIAVWLPSTLILFSRMNQEIYREAGNARRLQIKSAVSEVNDRIFAIIDAVAWICSDDMVEDAAAFSDLSERGAAVAVLDAQQRISAYMDASAAGNFLNKLVIFEPETGFSFEFVKWRSGSLTDADSIAALPEFRSLSFAEGTIVHLMLSETLNRPQEPAVVAFGRIRGADAYVYAEFSQDIFSPLLDPQAGIIRIFSDGRAWPDGGEALPDASRYSAEEYELEIPGCTAVHFQPIRQMRLVSSSGLAVLMVVIAASILLFVIVSVLLSRYLTKASSRLVKHIEHLMAEKDFGVKERSIEEGDDEIASIGRAVNAMSISIAELLKANERLFEDKKRMEISMLQMQVNPHFLYNTLESMHYLAEVQRNEGIARMSRGLSTLLRNLAKGSSSRIPLSEELSLLHDYDDIQQVRYMGMYELVYDVPEDLLDYRIQKFTLQPLVENAIFHGIEPSGRCGTITVSASLSDGLLSVSVTDDGVGMTEEELARIMEERKHSKTDMTGVGLRNIDERIKLVYGREYGLSFESEKGRYTKVTATIRAERE